MMQPRTVRSFRPEFLSTSVGQRRLDRERSQRFAAGRPSAAKYWEHNNPAYVSQLITISTSRHWNFMDGSHGVPNAAASEAFSETIAFAPPPIGELHARLMRRPRSHIVGGVSKRAFDIAMAAGAVVALAPVLLGVWALVRIDSPGPGLFRQRRGGFQGRPFVILKFRTMRMSTDRGIVQARREDDRTTRLGRFLRRYSIDELPQLINILIGDMSIVGPRPHALAHDRQFVTLDRKYAGRHHARPGITGLAQVSGARGLTDTRDKILERMNFDLKYVSTWTWLLDLKIIVKTAMVVLRDRSAF